jgi:hypothetical protein
MTIFSQYLRSGQNIQRLGYKWFFDSFLIYNLDENSLVTAF